METTLVRSRKLLVCGPVLAELEAEPTRAVSAVVVRVVIAEETSGSPVAADLRPGVLPAEVNGKYIDLVVTGDHGRLAIECDGSPYHSDGQQIHDDAERERELRRAGWTFWRVRSSAFALSPEEALAPLWKRLTDLGIHPRTTSATSTDDTEPHASWTPVGLAEAEPDDEDTDPYDGELDDDEAA
ncbi:hypothetical protein [Streptomyces sp. STR69]|uniref:hypothetical protein n=1 Tax=Streptomyces sp. STR69 TaxID=1796942 RepID=UPI0021CA90DD|nr:hypothetical protein [Streptomyces sp. STR69]